MATPTDRDTFVVLCDQVEKWLQAAAADIGEGTHRLADLQRMYADGNRHSAWLLLFAFAEQNCPKNVHHTTQCIGGKSKHLQGMVEFIL